MILCDKLNIIRKGAKSIDWKVFVDEIVPHFFADHEKGLVFVEVGSLDGKDTLYFKNAYKSSICHCIEGLPDNYNKYLVQLQSQVQCYNICISSYNGTIKFHQKRRLESGIHGIYDRGPQYGTKTLQLPTITFNQFCMDNNISFIDVIKIDVEGATYDVLDSIRHTVLPNIKILHIETEDYPFFHKQKLDKDCVKILEDTGFECLVKTGYRPSASTNGKQYDSVWINTQLF